MLAEVWHGRMGFCCHVGELDTCQDKTPCEYPFLTFVRSLPLRSLLTLDFHGSCSLDFSFCSLGADYVIQQPGAEAWRSEVAELGKPPMRFGTEVYI